VGESGCGKTTTARMIAGLVAPGAGHIRLEGRDVTAGRRRRADRARVQMVFQDPFASLNPVHTVFHHLARPLLAHRRARGPALRARVEALLAAVDLPPALAGRHPHQLSGGQRQRVAIARALALDPAVILADEPTSMLDASVRLEVLDLLRDLTVRLRAACLYITHDLASARLLADRTAVMYAGTIVEVGPTEEVIARPAHPYTRLLVGAQPAAAPGLTTPGGCPFAPRCPDVQARCRQEAPPPSPVAPGRLVRCHLYGTAS
jgi:peptide/nickel transport system ATP-binding protein